MIIISLKNFTHALDEFNTTYLVAVEALIKMKDLVQEPEKSSIHAIIEWLLDIVKEVIVLNIDLALEKT